MGPPSRSRASGCPESAAPDATRQARAGDGPGRLDLLQVAGVLDIGAATVDFSLLAGAPDDADYVIARYGSLAGGAFAARVQYA
jgi:hypothetical protein